MSAGNVYLETAASIPRGYLAWDLTAYYGTSQHFCDSTQFPRLQSYDWFFSYGSSFDVVPMTILKISQMFTGSTGVGTPGSTLTGSGPP